MCDDTRWCGKDSQPELSRLNGASSPLVILMAQYFSLIKSGVIEKLR